MSSVTRSEDLKASDFVSFFRDIHGKPPFPWQQRLMRSVLDRNEWPKIIDLPTGTGKTAVLDIAVFAMAVRPKTFPRRIVFVIDRRIVVDQVCQRAESIRDRIKEGKTPVLRLVRDRLSNLSSGSALEVAALRGGVPIDREWAQYPDRPWVVVSTVDQFGSRLLFRGYGVSRRMRPIHAGLAGNDCLVILDEVHLSIPFAKTLEQIAALKSKRLPRRFAVVEMSATPSVSTEERFVLDPKTDLDGCEELSRRVYARKEASLVNVASTDAIPNKVLKIVGSIEKNEKKIRSLGVVVNLVRTARETYRVLKDAGYLVWLVTGRMRPLDRMVSIEDIGPIVDPESESSDGLAIVVSTQAIEVGADFSFDAMITECAPANSLRQRFGRLDRRGRYSEQTGIPAQAWIIGPKSIVGSKKPDPIYGDASRETWQALSSRLKGDTLDVGSFALRNFPTKTNSLENLPPYLQKTHIETLVQTNPEPLVQPNIEWFLHGIKKNSPEVSIVWRADRSSEALKLIPPRQAEFLQIPIGAAKAWLSGNEETNVADLDQEESDSRKESPKEVTGGADLVRWSGFDKPSTRIQASEISPGDILIVEPARGGLIAGTWDPTSSDVVTDLGDLAQLAHRRRITLRLDSRLPHMNDERMPTPSDEIDADKPVHERIDEWLHQRLEMHNNSYTEIIRRLSRNFLVSFVTADKKKAEGYYVISERCQGTKKPAIDVGVMDGSDESGSMIGTDVTLKEHMKGVAERARLIARHLHLDDDLIDDLYLAGLLHDIGKVDLRFQENLVGGDPINLEHLKEPLAKSRWGLGGSKAYPTGMRHEIASVAMLESNTRILAKANDKDLVLHLVGTHHGWCRPLPPIIEDKESQKLSFTFNSLQMVSNSNLADSRIALDMADRFWRLVKHYGYYGIAWLESILRLADHQRSAEGF